MSPSLDRPTIEASADARGTYRIVGGAHLGIAAAANLLMGIALLYLGTTDVLVRMAFAGLDAYLIETVLLREAITVVAIATTGAMIVGAVLVALGLLAAVALHGVYTGRRTRWWIPASVASGLNPLVTPLAVIAAVLLWVAKPISEADAASGRSPSR